MQQLQSQISTLYGQQKEAAERLSLLQKIPMFLRTEGITQQIQQETDALTTLYDQAQLLEGQLTKLTTPAAEAPEIIPDKWRTGMKKFIDDFKGSSAAIQDEINKIDKLLQVVRGGDIELQTRIISADPTGAEGQRRLQAEESRLVEARQELTNKLYAIDTKANTRAVQEAGQSALERAKAVEDALERSLKRQTEQVKLAADEQRGVEDEAASARLRAEGPGAIEAIDRQRREARKAIAIKEAKDLLKIEMDGLTDRAAARKAVLEAAIVGAGKNTSAQVAAQAELTGLEKKTQDERVKIQADAAQTLQGISNKTFQNQANDARELNKIIEETAQDQLQSQIDLMDDRINLIEAQVDAEVLTTQQGHAQIQAIHQERFRQIEDPL